MGIAQFGSSELCEREPKVRWSLRERIFLDKLAHVADNKKAPISGGFRLN